MTIQTTGMTKGRVEYLKQVKEHSDEMIKSIYERELSRASDLLEEKKKRAESMRQQEERQAEIASLAARGELGDDTSHHAHAAGSRARKPGEQAQVRTHSKASVTPLGSSPKKTESDLNDDAARRRRRAGKKKSQTSGAVSPKPDATPAEATPPPPTPPAGGPPPPPAGGLLLLLPLVTLRPVSLLLQLQEEGRYWTPSAAGRSSKRPRRWTNQSPNTCDELLTYSGLTN